MSQPDGEKSTPKIDQSEQEHLAQPSNSAEKRFRGVSGTALRTMHYLRAQLERGVRTAEPGLVDEEVIEFEEQATVLNRLTAAARKDIHAPENAEPEEPEFIVETI
jgi:hypothetical protein